MVHGGIESSDGGCTDVAGNEYSKQTSFLHGDKFIEKSTSAKIHFSVKEVASWFGKKSAAM